MELAIERVLGLLIGLMLVSSVVSLATGYQTNSVKISDIIDKPDKALADLDMRDQKLDVFNKYDYLFIGMSNNHKSNVVYRLKGDDTTTYTIRKDSVSPKAVYQAVTRFDQFRDSLDLYDGLEYNYVKFKDGREGVDFK